MDWPERVNRQDYPQTDAARPWTSTLAVSFNGRPIDRITLPDDPADARGVLSHLAGVEHGSHGELVDGMIALNDSDRARLAAGEPLVLRLAVPDDAPQAGGLCIFGANTGEMPLDPTLEIHTRDPLPDDLGVGPDSGDRPPTRTLRNPDASESGAARRVRTVGPECDAGPDIGPSSARSLDASSGIGETAVALRSAFNSRCRLESRSRKRSPRPVNSQCGSAPVNSMKRRIVCAGIVHPLS